MKLHSGREITVEENKALLLQGLCKFRDVCEKYDLTYFIMFGTLIGAVRHKGYIPWDDDIDVVMPRTDYEKLIKLASELESEEWEIISYKTQPGYCFPWVKFCNKTTQVLPSRFNTGYVYGSSVDVFPLEDIEAETEESALKIANELHSKYSKAVQKYKYTGVYSTGLTNSIKRFIKKVYFIYTCRRNGSWKRRIRKLDKEILSYSGPESEYVAFIYIPYKNRVFKRTDFIGVEPVKLVFEGEYFDVPAHYDRVLTHIYGDYMSLPPEKDRVIKHTAKIMSKQ